MIKNDRYQCPKCARKFESVDAAVFPFCSHRCKLIDLSNWLNEEYGLPYEDGDPDEAAYENQANMGNYEDE